FFELAAEHPASSLEELHRISQTHLLTKKWRILTATRASLVKHTNWDHENEVRLLTPKSGDLAVLPDVLKRIHYVRRDRDHWPDIVQLLATRYPSVELMHWQFAHGKISAIPTPMEIRLIPV